MKNALKLYLVTDRTLSQGRSLEQVVTQAVAGGVTMVQLREKECSTGEFIDLALRLKQILKPLNIPLIINDRVDVAMAVDADGVHIGQSDMPYSLARQLLGADKIIGLSVESLDDLICANELDVDYVGISPVYGTPTKTDTAEPFGLGGLKEAVRISLHPTVAIGGMNRDTAADIMAAGCDGIAVVSAISSAENIKEASSELKSIVDKSSRELESTDIEIFARDIAQDEMYLDKHKLFRGMDIKQLGEFGFIELIKRQFPVEERFVGIGDDCAVLPATDNQTLVSTDLLIEGVHFLRSESLPEDVGWKAAAVNMSDIAAMGGTAEATFLSIALPKDAQGDWAERFIEGYAQISRLYNVPLLGGDTTSSLRDIAINVTIVGRVVATDKAAMRSGAKVGQTIYVTGPLGDSAAGLQAILQGIERNADVKVLIARHKRPTPRLVEGQRLLQSGKVGAMMDISDGIASDLRHIMRASGVGVVVNLDCLPYSCSLERVCCENGWDRYSLAVSGGEDYELLFTAPEGLEQEIDISIYPIGRIVAGDELIWCVDNKPVELNWLGYKHF